MGFETEEVFRAILDWQARGLGVALATVVRTWGSSPRAAGSHLAATESGGFAGSVSGGCIEGEVVREACEAIRSGRPRLLEFGVSDERAWEAGLSCGGRLQVYVERIERSGEGAAAFERIAQALAARRPLARIVRLADAEQALIEGKLTSGALALSGAAAAEARAMLAQGASGMLESEPGLFVRAYAPAPRLLLIGAVHIAQVLAPMATAAGFEVSVIDPRRAFAAPERFPGTTLCAEWPDEAMAAIGLDAATAVVTLAHDPKLDDPALAAALASPAFYVGALGSRRTHEKRLARLAEMGLAGAAARIHAPVGLDLGGRAPAEIAVAILAELIRVRHLGEAR
ncbi:MAG: XdhC family protein [Rhodocyclaceae bacterium]